jgi:prepilin-type N-terminal cleavage/methylation domain-containing protein
MKRSGFTMIELIFVIVILGILAAVAIPKLAATRDDAKVSKLASNVSTLVSDAGAYYTSQGLSKWAAPAKWSDLTNVELYAGATNVTPIGTTTITSSAYINADATHNCFAISTTADGNLTVAAGTDTTSVACKGAQDLAASMVKSHSFGGTGIVR